MSKKIFLFSLYLIKNWIQITLQKNIDIINSVMFKNNINYRVYSFSSFSEELKELMNSNIGQIIYILDIELEDASGLDIASEIRKKDLDSFYIHTSINAYGQDGLIARARDGSALQ